MKRGVSMPELLVVLVIIMVLMAIMLPAFIQAKNRASGGVCYSNLGQIHKALSMYASDHDNTYPPNLWALHLPDKVVVCRWGTPYNLIWQGREARDPILVVDSNRGAHAGRALGLYASGSIQSRGAEGNPNEPDFWR